MDAWGRVDGWWMEWKDVDWVVGIWLGGWRCWGWTRDGLRDGMGVVDTGAGTAHLLEKQWAADATQQVWTRLPAQKLFPM